MATGREFDVTLEAQDDGGYVASVPDLPGVWTQGDTREEAVAMVKDAITGFHETLEDAGRPLPKPNREHLTVQA